MPAERAGRGLSRDDVVKARLLAEVLAALSPDVVVVGGDVLAKLEVRDLNNGLPTFRMITRCAKCGAQLTRDTVDVRDYDDRRAGLLRRQFTAATRHYQAQHAAPE